MPSRTFRPEWTRENLLRGMAIVSLVIAFADLGTTLPCCAEEFGLPVSAVDSRAPVNDSRGHDRGHGQVCLPSSDNGSTDDPVDESDGCFCCALGIHATLHVAEDRSILGPAIDSREITLPTSPPNCPYRPPRFA